MKLKDPFSIYSHIFFLIPLYFAIIVGAKIHAIIITALFLVSILFHGSKPKGPVWWHKTGELNIYQKVFLWTDTFVGMSLIVLNLFVFWQKGFPDAFWWAMIFAVIALFILFFKTKEQEYDFYHGTWHILASLITLLAVVS
ncbi:MAG: hypothetical protein WAV15_02900 [Minisyncoccia bacterium]